MAVTPNYGWPIPVATDYVKDGWDAIADLGNAIDTTVAGLGSGLTLVSTQTVSAASTISFNNCFSSTYANYKVFFAGVASTNTALYLRYRTSGSDNTGSNYDTQYIAANAATVGSNRYSNASYSYLLQNIVTTANTNLDMTIFSPNLAAVTTYTAQSFTPATVEAYLQYAGGAFDTTTVFDGFSIFPASGTITGTAKVYGLEN